jgi:transcription elongation GreA/GreB family factor
MQFEPPKLVLGARVPRRLRRKGLSEEANNIEWEGRREVKLLRAETERLRRELEAKCIEVQSIRELQDLNRQKELEALMKINMELAARVQELEAKLEQKEVESEAFEDADSVTVYQKTKIALAHLLSDRERRK